MVRTVVGSALQAGAIEIAGGEVEIRDLALSLSSFRFSLATYRPLFVVHGSGSLFVERVEIKSSSESVDVGLASLSSGSMVGNEVDMNGMTIVFLLSLRLVVPQLQRPPIRLFSSHSSLRRQLSPNINIDRVFRFRELWRHRFVWPEAESRSARPPLLAVLLVCPPSHRVSVPELCPSAVHQTGRCRRHSSISSVVADPDWLVVRGNNIVVSVVRAKRGWLRSLDTRRKVAYPTSASLVGLAIERGALVPSVNRRGSTFNNCQLLVVSNSALSSTAS
ncbi:hypothetical protein BLNAU_22997 [Blattamonas nauphoetae]|uniref:Uncharacterized protein n=1 Tax=Blattamonas nauphoetae TaxID=2049346 RepID=A0ABQ9WRH0_9EUKA|nr:hypothetical protein BLNAU_22997 [Blattamonas nauphoetae]